MADLPSLRPLHGRPVPPALFVVCLAATASACNGSSGTGDPLRDDFPKYAAVVLQRGAELTATARGFEVIQTGAAGRSKGQVALPPSGEQTIAFSLRGGAEVRVREVGLSGAGRIDERAVVYDLPGGKSYWSATASGAEEWLLFEPDAVPAGRPAVIWEVAGATPLQRGKQIGLYSDRGRRLLTVTAPKAFLADGSDAPVHLTVRGSTIELHVETRGQRALVDPVWSYVAYMYESRLWHKAQKLTNGRVLVAGGLQEYFDASAIGGSSYVDSSYSTEEYDPVFDEWILLPELGSAHVEHAMVTQPGSAPPNGAVMVIAGHDGYSGFHTDVEVYDGNFWEYYPSLYEPRASHTATRLMDDRVLVTGGYNDCGGGSGSGEVEFAVGPGVDQIIGSGFCFLCSTEVYDPSAGSGSGGWIESGSLEQCRALHTETLLDDGSVLVTGGEEGGVGILATAERWSPATEAWMQVAPMNQARALHTATKLNDGRVLVTGGNNDDFILDTAEIYDPVANTWTLVGPMNDARWMHTAVLTSEGTVLIAGGRNDFGTTPTAEVFDPMTGQFTFTASMNEFRSLHTETLLDDGNVLVTGGGDLFDDPAWGMSSAEIFSLLNPLGFPCEEAADCMSGFCADGVCCDMACDSPCEACTEAARGGFGNDNVPLAKLKSSGSESWGLAGGSGSGLDGFCGPVYYDEDPADDCPDLDPSTCGTMGTCDGDGSCRLWEAETACQFPTCDGSIVKGAGLCDGEGTCLVDPDVDCGAFACVDGVCAEDCQSSEECSSFAFCGNGQTCVPKLPDGAPSFDGEQCISGFSIDGVCCDQPCDGDCQACSVATGASKNGTCTPLSNVGCSDGSACTVNDVCMAGVCVPGAAIQCAGSVGCDGGFACDPKTGECTVPVAPKTPGTACDDGLLCTVGEACNAAGECVGSPMPCTPGECQTGGTCDEGAGCQFDNKADYTPCTEDDNPCTIGFCLGGDCKLSSIVDGTPCPGGTCIGGSCLPDGARNPTGAGPGGGGAEGGAGGGGSTPTGGEGGAGGEGGSGGTGGSSGAVGGNAAAYELLGGACSTSSGAGSNGGAGLGGAAALAALALAGVRRRRRREDDGA